jgi:phosphopantothenoylcysteine decarboxylase/phosphopantothenate--cysteine ligase
VRFLGNRSSGKQGHAIATELAARGAEVTLVTGPVSLPDPANVTTIHIQTAEQMYHASLSALPCDVAICAAAVADWRIDSPAPHKTKKTAESPHPPRFTLVENPDILRAISQSDHRPGLVVGFAAETDDLLEHARAKRTRKGCDWIVANQVGGTAENAVFGADENQVILITHTSEHEWPRASKQWIARQLAQQITAHFATQFTADAAKTQVRGQG